MNSFNERCNVLMDKRFSLARLWKSKIEMLLKLKSYYLRDNSLLYNFGISMTILPKF